MKVSNDANESAFRHELCWIHAFAEDLGLRQCQRCNEVKIA